MKEMRELEELHLKGDWIDDMTIHALWVLPQMPNLIQLTVVNSEITSIHFVNYLYNIQDLVIEDNYGADSSRNGTLDPLFDLLESSANLKQLSFDLVAMTPPYLIKLCDSAHLERQRKLEELCMQKGVEHRIY